MKQLRKEFLSDVYLGNVFFPDYVSNPENSFSKAIPELDEYSQSNEPIGKLNPIVQAMGIQSKDIDEI